MLSNSILLFGAILVLLSQPAIPALAQDYERVPSKPALPVSAAYENQLPKDSNAVIIPALKGLVFLSSVDAVGKRGVKEKGIVIPDLQMLKRSRFEAEVSAYIGKPLTFRQLDEITRKVVAFYRTHNRPLVDVVVPEQDVQTGTVQIVVTEFRVGQVRAEGNHWFSDRVVTAPFSLNKGDTVDSNQLLGALDAANANPFRHVNLLYEPSAQPGYTDVVLQTQDRFPLRVYSGFDNSGTPLTGRDRWNVGANWGNALWHDQQVSYQFSTSSSLFSGRTVPAGEPGGPTFMSHSLSWSMPLSGHTSVSVFGAYERTVPSVGQDFGLLGRAAQAGIRYNIALPRTQTLIESVQIGYDFKITNNNLDFGGTQVSRNWTEVDQFPIGYSATLNDRCGVTASTSTLVYSPGGITPNNNDSAFQPDMGQSGRPFARANYTYVREDLTRLNKLPLGATWSTRFVGQISNRALLDTEQLAAGGPDFLRGYQPFALLGDQGMMLSNELRTPSFGSTSSEALREKLLGHTQFLGFWDYADLHNRNPVDNVLPKVNGSSLGVGLRYNLRAYASFRFDYGWALQPLPATTRGQLANFALVVGN